MIGTSTNTSTRTAANTGSGTRMGVSGRTVSVTRFGNKERRVIQLKNPDGTSAGTISVTRTIKSAQKKKKKVGYNFKQISAQILRSRTSVGAGKAALKARSVKAMLARKLLSEDYDKSELRAAIIHAAKMERIAKKRKKHMEEEEQAAQTGVYMEQWENYEEEDWMAGFEDLSSESTGLSQEELEALMRELEAMMAEAMQDMAEIEGLGELTEELTASVQVNISPEDLERLKKKHRMDEMREIADADMKYLKAMFQKLEQERRSAGSSLPGSSGGSDQSGGSTVIRGISGMGGMTHQMAIAQSTMQAMNTPTMAEGANVDVSL